jgi:hypothetical protein
MVYSLTAKVYDLSAMCLPSWVEIKPASKGRNDPASEARIRTF